MSELVGERTYAGTCVIGSEARRAGIVVEHQSVVFGQTEIVLGVIVIVGLGGAAVVEIAHHIPVVWPDGISYMFVRLGVAGVDDIYEVDIAVLVIVVEGEVHTLFVGFGYGIHYEVAGIGIQSF